MSMYKQLHFLFLPNKLTFFFLFVILFTFSNCTACDFVPNPIPAQNLCTFEPQKKECALLAIGGGYLDAGPRHSGSVFQVEYRWGRFFRYLRPQVSLLFPECCSCFFGIGLGLEIYIGKYFVITPNFAPGIYCKCKKGRDLGCPLEFRSTFEFAFEIYKGLRLGGQVSHISNASITNHNPGMNAFVIFFAFPI